MLLLTDSQVGGILSHHAGPHAPFVLRAALCALGFFVVLVAVPRKSSTQMAKKAMHCDVLSVFLRYKKIYLTVGIACFVLSYIRQVRYSGVIT